MVETGFRKWIITITVIIASLLELIDTTIVNVSLPNIQGNLGATLEDVAWVVTGYSVANVIILPMSGWLGGRLGRKEYYIASIILFTVASFLCGNATSLPELVLFRVVQGVAGGGLISTSQAILMETWPPDQVGLATALFGLGAVVGPTVGPTIGGYITDHYSWRWIFYVNLPVGALAAFCTLTFVKPKPKEEGNRKVDWWGILLLAVAVGSLQTVLEKGETEDWFSKTYILVLTIAAVLGTLLFIWRESSIDYPIVNFAIMRHRSFSVGMITTFIMGFGLYGSVFVFPVFCQTLLGFTAEQTGLILFPGGFCTILVMPFVGKMLNRGLPPQILATVGMFLFYVFTTLLSKSSLDVGTGDFFLPLVIRGVSMGLLFVPLTTLAIADLRGKEIGQGTGLNNMMRQLGGSFGIATLTTLIHIREAVHRSDLINNIRPDNPYFISRINFYTQSFLAKGKSAFDAARMAYEAIEGIVIKQTLLLTYNDAYWITGLIMLISIPLMYLQPLKKAVEMPKDAH